MVDRNKLKAGDTAHTIFEEEVTILGAEADPYGGVQNWYVRYTDNQQEKTVPFTWIKSD